MPPKTRATASVHLNDEEYPYIDSLYMKSEGRPYQQCPTGKQILGRILKMTYEKVSVTEVSQLKYQ